MRDQRIGTKLRRRTVGIAEIDDDDRHARISGGTDIGCAVTNHDGIGGDMTKPLDHLQQVTGVRFADRQRIAPDHNIAKETAHVEPVEDELAQILRLVGADPESEPPPLKDLQRVDDTRKGF